MTAPGTGELRGRLGADQVREMFDRIAPRYDLMNRLMSLGLDGRWREHAAAAADLAAGDQALDCCTGTGDLAFALADRTTPAGCVVGIDFSEGMLARARAKAPEGARVEFAQGDVTALRFADDRFDAATIAFGIRNVERLETALAEMVRVVRPGGRVVVLEITTPTRLAAALSTWFERLVPRLGRLVGRDARAYAYLPASVRRFPPPPELARTMAGAGLDDVRWRTFVGGMVALHHGRVG